MEAAFSEPLREEFRPLGHQTFGFGVRKSSVVKLGYDNLQYLYIKPEGDLLDS